MINDKTVLAIIPARGGSKGVPRKNVRPLAGKPLVAWTIEEAKKSKYIDRLILSSEDDEIIGAARSYGCEVPFKRPQDLALDHTPGIDPVLHALSALPEKYDYIVLLQPTSPLREASDIDGCLSYCLQYEAPACVTVTDPDKSPYWAYSVDYKMAMRPLIERENPEAARRQELPRLYVLNGAVYAAESQWLIKSMTFLTKETVAYFMPRERSVDIDTELDLKICNYLLLDRKKP